MSVYSGGNPSWQQYGGEKGPGKTWDIFSRSGRSLVEVHCCLHFGPNATKKADRKALNVKSKGDGTREVDAYQNSHIWSTPSGFRNPAHTDNAGTVPAIYGYRNVRGDKVDLIEIKFDQCFKNLLYWNVTPGWRPDAAFGDTQWSRFNFEEFVPSFSDDGLAVSTAELEPWKSGASPATEPILNAPDCAPLRKGSLLRLTAGQGKSGSGLTSFNSFAKTALYCHFVFDDNSSGTQNFGMG